MDVQQLARLNSMTKYPSILTYHQLGERGKLDEHIQVPFEDDEDVFVTEKVDGTNTRIIFLPSGDYVLNIPDGDYIIGSREELLHARGDRIWVPTEGIVDTLKEHDIVSRVYKAMFGKQPDMPLANVWVVFGEVFGGKTGQAKQYTAKKATGFRIFDVLKIPRPLADDMVLGREWDRQKISVWRQHGGQTFLSNAELEYWFSTFLTEPLTPRLGTFKGKDIPKAHKDVLEWLQQFAKTRCRLDDGAKAKSEGVVIRNADRSKIAKIRFEDYERTLRPQKPPMKKGKSK